MIFLLFLFEIERFIKNVRRISMKMIKKLRVFVVFSINILFYGKIIKKSTVVIYYYIL